MVSCNPQQSTCSSSRLAREAGSTPAAFKLHRMQPKRSCVARLCSLQTMPPHSHMGTSSVQPTRLLAFWKAGQLTMESRSCSRMSPVEQSTHNSWWVAGKEQVRGHTAADTFSGEFASVLLIMQVPQLRHP